MSWYWSAAVVQRINRRSYICSSLHNRSHKIDVSDCQHVLIRSVYISSACAGLAASLLPFSTFDLSASSSVCPATRTELFPDWLPFWIVASKSVFSRFSTGSWMMAAPSRGSDWLSSEGSDEESDWTAGLSASSVIVCEEEGSVRMFLEITRVIKEYIINTLSHQIYYNESHDYLTSHYQLKCHQLLLKLVYSLIF